MPILVADGRGERFSTRLNANAADAAALASKPRGRGRFEGQRPGLGSEFFAEVAQVLQRIEDARLFRRTRDGLSCADSRTQCSSSWIPTSLLSRPSCTGNGTLNGGRCGADA